MFEIGEYIDSLLTPNVIFEQAWQCNLYLWLATTD